MSALFLFTPFGDEIGKTFILAKWRIVLTFIDRP